MIKHYFLSTFLLNIILWFGACDQPPKRNCSDYKTGKFRFSTQVDEDTLTTLFDRTTALEKESFQGKQDTSTVRWINDCEYILKKIRPKNRSEEKSVHIKILTTTDSSYTFEFNAVGESKKLRGTAYKIH